MSINFQEILKELEYRVDKGIIDLTKEEQVTKLTQILKENGVSDANEIAQKARVYFSYINEAPKKKGDSGLEAAAQFFKGKKYKNSKGNKIAFTTAINYNDPSDSAHNAAMSDFESFLNANKGKYGSIEKAKQPEPETPTANVFGKDKGGKVFEPKPEPTPEPSKSKEKEEPTKKPSGEEEEDANESPKYDKNNQYQRAIAEAKTSQELQKALTNLHAIEEQKMFKNKIAGAGGMVASTGESMYVGISSDLIHGTSEVKNSSLYQKTLQARQKNTQKILDSQKGREFKQLAVELEAISISQKLDLKNPNDLKTAIQIYNEREAYVTAYDSEFKKTNVGKDSKFKKEEARTSWIRAAYMGSLSLIKNGPANWNRERGNGTVMKANGVTDGATEELLNNKLKAAKTPEERAHYERELKMWNKFKGYHDTYLVYTNDKGHVEVFNVSNKKSRDLNDPQNNTTPAKRLKNYMEEAKKRGIAPDVIVKLAKAEQKAQKGAEDMNAIAMAGYDEINKNDIKSIAYIGQRLSGRGNIKSEDDATDEYLTALGNDKLIKNKIKDAILKKNPNATKEQIQEAQSNITPEQTVQYALEIWNDPNVDKSTLSGNYSKFILKIGTLSQSIYDKSKSMTPEEISESMGGVYTPKDIQNILNPKTTLGKTMAALKDVKERHAAGLNGVHVGFMNDLHKADGTKPGHTGPNGPAVQTYVAGTLSSLHIDTYVENYDDKVLVEMGGVGVTPRDMRSCMAKLSGYTGKTDTPEERNALKEHLIKSVKVDATTGAVYLVGNNGNNVRIASDTWRQAGANTKKVATAYGPELQNCLKNSVKNRK
jgi:hypothetical protein